MTPKSRERAAVLARNMLIESKVSPGYKPILDLLKETQDHFAKCLEDTESVVALHVEDIKALIGHCMALAKRVRVIEERLGIAGQAEIPGD